MSQVAWFREVGRRVKQINHEIYGHISEPPAYCNGSEALIVVSLDSGGVYWMNKADWEPIPRPSSPAWNGEGNPPVGVTCWVHPHNTCWGFSSTSGHKRSILAYHGDYVWLGYEGQPLETTRVDKVDFSPIRTPEQIAAELADQAIKKIAVIICRDGAFDIDDPEVMESAVALYDAGLRFTDTEQPK